MNVNDLLGKLSGVRKTSSGWQARCPAHEDKNSSLAVAVGGDGRILLHCHARCGLDAVLAALALTKNDLFADSNTGRTATATATPRPGGKVHATLDAAIKAARWGLSQGGEEFHEVQRWRYNDVAGDTVMFVVRFESALGRESKQFRPIHPVANGWQIGDPDGALPLFHLDELVSADARRKVTVSEGEKAADAARALDILATTSAHGAKSAKRTDWTPLAGRIVFVFPDNDPAGEAYAQDVAAILAGLSTPALVQIVRLPGLPPGGDMADWVAQRPGKTPAELRIELARLIAAAPVESPAPTPEPVPTAAPATARDAAETPLATTPAPPIPAQALAALDTLQGRGEAANPTATTGTEQPGKTSEFYYEKHRKEYLLRNGRGVWLSLTESQFRKELAHRGVSTKRNEGAPVSAADAAMIDLRDKWDVDFAGALAGYSAGFYEAHGHRLLVTNSPTIPAAVPGSWPTLEALIDGLLLDPIVDQRPYFFGWLKTAVASLRSGNRRPGQALAIAGPHECGKSLLQQLVTIALGGRVAKPYAFMTERTQFNADLFEAEHLAIEDEPASTDIRTRRAFGAQLKQITACDSQRCHAKHKQALTLSPFWRITISLNDEPENLMVLPPLDDSLADKLIILRAQKRAMPMATDTTEGRVAFWARLVAELPGLLAFLEAWEIPEDLRSQRYGVTHYHHPQLVAELDALTPEARLLTILDSELFGTPAAMAWSGSAEELETRLTSDGRNQYEARRLFSWNTACGVYLARLARKYPERFILDRDSRRRTWRIEPRRDAA